MSQDRVDPRADVGRFVLDSARELLENDAVSLDDTFVAVGGNSLLATMLVSRVEEELGVRPTMTDAFSLTLRELAAAIEAQLVEDGSWRE